MFAILHKETVYGIAEASIFSTTSGHFQFRFAGELSPRFESRADVDAAYAARMDEYVEDNPVGDEMGCSDFDY